GRPHGRDRRPAQGDEPAVLSDRCSVGRFGNWRAAPAGGPPRGVGLVGAPPPAGPPPPPASTQRPTPRSGTLRRSVAGPARRGGPEEVSQQLGGTKGTIYASAEGNDGVYLVGFVDLPEGTVTGDNASELLDKVVEEGAKGTDGKVLKSRAIKLGKHPGREITFS